MSHPGPLGDDEPDQNPFAGLPFLGDVARMLHQQGPVSWDAARQIAVQVAGTGEPNVDPAERIRLEELARVAELQVTNLTGLPASTGGRPVTVLAVTRAEWARRTLDAYRPLFERMAGGLAAAQDAPAEEAGDPTAQLLGGLMKMVGPVMLGLQAGAMVGHLAQKSLGQYDLPLPRPPGDEITVVHANLEEFAKGWSIDGDDLRLWVCVHELTHHAVLGRPHVRDRIQDLVGRYVESFEVDPAALERRLGEVDPTDPTALQQALGDPEAMLGAMVSPAQRALRPELDAVLAAVVGYVDHVVDQVGGSLIGSFRMLTEALHRRRVEASPSDRFVQHLLGLELGRAQYERGEAFVEGIVERAGPDALGRLWVDEAHLPTPNEVDAPGLWLARIELG